MSFFNTVGLTGEDLKKAHKDSKSLESKVMEIYEAYPPMTPYEVFEKLEFWMYSYPITSVRRAISDLTKKGFLEKTKRKRQGAYGMLNYVWKVK